MLTHDKPGVYSGYQPAINAGPAHEGSAARETRAVGKSRDVSRHNTVVAVAAAPSFQAQHRLTFRLDP